MENEKPFRSISRARECLQHFMPVRAEIAQRAKQENQFNVIYIFFVLCFRLVGSEKRNPLQSTV